MNFLTVSRVKLRGDGLGTICFRGRELKRPSPVKEWISPELAFN